MPQAVFVVKIVAFRYFLGSESNPHAFFFNISSENLTMTKRYVNVADPNLK